MRHTRRVRWLRRAVPATGLVVLALMVGYAVVAHYIQATGFAPIRITFDGIVMDNPDISGTYGTNSYQITARRALQKLGRPRRFALEDVEARLQFGNHVTLVLGAPSGEFNQETGLIELENGIRMNTSIGYSAEFEKLNISLSNGEVASVGAFSINLPGGRLSGDHIHYDEGSGAVRVSGRVTMQVNGQ